MNNSYPGIYFTMIASCVAVVCNAKEGAFANRPNIVLIYADDIGYGDFSCNGSTTIHTPCIDRAATNGLLFTNVHSAAATSTPSRYALLTGEYAWRKEGTTIATGDAASIIRPERYTMANLFKEAGYVTAAIGKWHLGMGEETGKQDWNAPIKPGLSDIGFDYSFVMPATGDRVPCVFVENDKVVNLDPNDSIFVSYEKNFSGEPTGADHPELLTMLPSQGHNMSIVNGISRIGYMKGGKSALWKDEFIAEIITDKATEFITQHKGIPFFLYFATQDAHVPRVPGRNFVGKSGMGPRGDCLLEFDWSVGQILNKLKELGLQENTIVIISSDNGPVVDDGYQDSAVELLGDHKPSGIYRGGKYSRFEAGTRVPCILYWPGTIQPGASDALLCQIDWFAAFAHLLKVEIPPGAALDSEGMLTTWLGKSRKGREWLIVQNESRDYAVINRNWKYICPSNEAPIGAGTLIELGNTKEPQLYNLKNDPGEKHNLAAKYPLRIEQMEKKMRQITLLSKNLPVSIGEIYPDELQCEYLINPQAVDVVNPRLFWINKAVHNEQRGQRQTAWQIRVATNLDLLLAENPDLWDSGRIENDSSLFIEYRGKALKSRQQCWWQVRVWDADKKSSKWSKPAYWGMGLLEEKDWKANWIGVPWQEEDATLLNPSFHKVLENTSPAPLLRKTFTIQQGKKVQSARVYTTGLGYFELYLNGDKVGTDVLVPAQTNYDRRPGLINCGIPVEDNFMEYKVMYLCYDLTKQLQVGQNAIGAILGNGFYNSDSGWTMPYGSPRFIAQLHIEYVDGTNEVIVTDPSWKVSKSAILHNGVYTGEMYDANREQQGWSQAKFNDSAWKLAVVRSSPYGKLKANMAPTDRIMSHYRPIEIQKIGDKHYHIDFGEEISGWVSLRHIQNQLGDTISVKYISESNNGQHVYICKGGQESYAPRFTWYVFREVEILGWNGDLTTDNIVADAVYTGVETTGRFECSNDLFNKINRMFWRSLTDNLHGSIMSDCPHRERSPYTGDGQLACASAMHNLDMSAFYTKWIDDIRGSQNPITGYVPNSAPWQPGCGGGVAWGAAINIMPWEFYLHYGDRIMLEHNFEAMKMQTNYLENWKLGDGTILAEAPLGSDKPNEWMNLGDWSPAAAFLPNELVHTFYFWRCADLVARVAQILNRDADAIHYYAIATDVRNAFITKFYNKDTGSFGKYGANIFALYMMKDMNIEIKDHVIQSLRRDIAETEGHLDTGAFATQFFFEVLAENGLNELAFEAMNKRTYPSYGYWVEQGATTTWEEWGGRHSHNHPMFGGALTWFYRCLAGVRVDESTPGFKHILFRPQPIGDVNCASYYTRTLYGDAGIKWEQKDGKLFVDITIPIGTTATVYMPMLIKKSSDSVEHNCNDLVELVGIEKECIIYKIHGSGKFHLISN